MLFHHFNRKYYKNCCEILMWKSAGACKSLGLLCYLLFIIFWFSGFWIFFILCCKIFILYSRFIRKRDKTDTNEGATQLMSSTLSTKSVFQVTYFSFVSLRKQKTSSGSAFRRWDEFSFSLIRWEPRQHQLKQQLALIKR